MSIILSYTVFVMKFYVFNLLMGSKDTVRDVVENGFYVKIYRDNKYIIRIILQLVMSDGKPVAIHLIFS